MKDTPAYLRSPRFFLLIPIVILSLLSVFGYFQILDLIESNEAVNHANVVKNNLEKSLSLLKDAETGQRGFLLTMDSAFLDPYFNAGPRINAVLKEVDSLVAASPDQLVGLAKYKRVIRSRLYFLGSLIQESGTKSITVDRLQIGKTLMDSARNHVNRMIYAEEILLQQRLSVMKKQTRITPNLYIGLVVCVIAVLVYGYFRIIRELSTSKKLQAVLAQANQELEASKALQVELRTEQRFQLIANTMPQQLWTAAPTGELNYYSQSVFDFSGLTFEQIQKDGWLQIVHPEDREENVREWMYSVSTGQPFHFEHRFRRANGEYRWQLSRAVPQFDETGKIILWVGTSTDIQDQKMFAQELERLVQERTQSLQKIATDLQAMNDELSQFNYVASHDLQEPLRKIQTFISRISETEESLLSERGKLFFNKIQESAVRMQKLTNDLLTYSRTKATDKHFELTDLNLVLQTVLDQLKPTIEEKNARITCDLLPVISAIPFQFEQLFSNLLSNALKFAIAGVPPQVSIRYRKATQMAEGKNSDFHVITVKDNGIGFEREYAQRIFQVFQRLHSKTAYEGTGIGLAIVKKIVENHNGSVVATGSLGEGAEFTIHLPVTAS